MNILATAHAQALYSGWVQNTLVQELLSKKGYGHLSKWRYFREGTVLIHVELLYLYLTLQPLLAQSHNIR